MSRHVITVTPDTAAWEAAELLTRHGFAALPVVDVDGVLVGMVAEADLLAVAMPAAGPASVDQGRSATAHRTVGALMHTPVRCLSPGTHVSAAAEELVREHLRGMPVVEGGTLVGMVSRADLLAEALRADGLGGEGPQAPGSGPAPMPPAAAVPDSHEPAGTAARPARSLGAAVRAHLVNPVVRRVLRTPAHRLMSGSVLLLEYTGRRSGVRHALPAMFAETGDRLVVIAGQPETKTWWHNFGTRPQAVVATVAGRRRSYQASRPDARTDQYRQALAAYRRRFPRVPVEDGTPLIVLIPADQP